MTAPETGWHLILHLNQRIAFHLSRLESLLNDIADWVLRRLGG